MHQTFKRAGYMSVSFNLKWNKVYALPILPVLIFKGRGGTMDGRGGLEDQLL